jgi:4-amino-4-deoxy-L-arabinose transferase-like glycosyltransferase
MPKKPVGVRALENQHEGKRTALDFGVHRCQLGAQMSAWLRLVAVAGLALVVFLFRLGVADWRGDVDTQQAQIIQEIRAGHGWVLPLRNGRHLPEKPPLFSWLGALSATVRHSGGDAWDARLPSALFGTLCVIAVYGFAHALAGEKVAGWAALMLVTTPQFIIAARDSHVDMVFCAFLTFGLMLAWRFYDGVGGRRTALLAGLCLGLATLSKGPLAFVLTGLVFGVTALLLPPPGGWRTLVTFPALMAAVVPPALWYLAATAEHGLAFVRLQLLDENVGRLTGGLGHWPVGYYIVPLLALGLPWTLALPGAVADESGLPLRARRFLWIWVGVMLVFFSLAFGKRQVYILPLRPALAIILAGWLVPFLDRLRGLPRPGTTPRAVHAASAALVLGGLAGALVFCLGFGGLGAAPQQWSYWWRLYLQEHMLSAVVLIAGVGIGIDVILRWTWERRFDLALYGLVATLAVGWTIGFSSDAIVRGEAVSFRPLAQRVSAAVAPTEPLAFLDVEDETAIGLLYHLRRHVPVVQSLDGQGPCTPPSPGVYLIAEKRWDERDCAADRRWNAITRGGPEISSHRSQRLVLARFQESPR